MTRAVRVYTHETPHVDVFKMCDGHDFLSYKNLCKHFQLKLWVNQFLNSPDDQKNLKSYSSDIVLSVGY